MKKTNVCQYVSSTVVYARMSICTQSVQCVTKTTTKNPRYLLQQMSFSVGVTIRKRDEGSLQERWSCDIPAHWAKVYLMLMHDHPVSSENTKIELQSAK